MQTQVPRTVPEPRSDQDEEQAAREWADEQAEKIGRIWLTRYPRGRDW